MNKKSIIYSIFLVISFFLFVSKLISAVEPTSSMEEASPSAITVTVNKEVEELKEKVAEKVSELSVHKAISGIVREKKDNVITLETNDNEVTVKVDEEITKIYLLEDGKKKDSTIEEIKKSMYLVVTGPIIGNAVTANVLYIDEEYIVKSGKITEVDPEEFVVKLLSTERDEYTLDFELTTKASILDIETLEHTKAGFSKLIVGDTAHFVVKRSDKGSEANRFPALRLFVIPQEYFLNK